MRLILHAWKALGITVLPKKREGKNKLLAQCNIQHQITNFGFSPFFGFSFSYSNIGENERHPSISWTNNHAQLMEANISLKKSRTLMVCLSASKVVVIRHSMSKSPFCILLLLPQLLARWTLCWHTYTKEEAGWPIQVRSKKQNPLSNTSIKQYRRKSNYTCSRWWCLNSD